MKTAYGRRTPSNWSKATSCKCGAHSYIGHLMRCETGEAASHVYSKGAGWHEINKAQQLMEAWRQRRRASKEA